MIIIRLWHIKLFSVLPREQLIAQWRELSAIAGAIQKNGTPNHLLVNFVLEYDFDHFISYAFYLRQEMTKRGYRTTNTVWDKIWSLKPDFKFIPEEEVYKEKMNNEYLIICYYNLKEKFLCEGITSKDWENISNLVNKQLQS